MARNTRVNGALGPHRGTERRIEAVSCVQLVRLQLAAAVLNELDQVVARGSHHLNVAIPDAAVVEVERLYEVAPRRERAPRRASSVTGPHPVCTIADCPEPRENVRERLVHSEHCSTVGLQALLWCQTRTST